MKNLLVIGFILAMVTSCSSASEVREGEKDTKQITTSQNTEDYEANPSDIRRSYTGPAQHSTYTSDYTTTDPAIGLVWKTCSEGLSGADCSAGTALTLNWADAKNKCNLLNTANVGAGYAGIKSWRLPNRQELETLIDYNKENPSIDATAFPRTVTSDYWSSTTYAPDTSYAWVVYFDYGAAKSNAKPGIYYTRCVSGP